MGPRKKLGEMLLEAGLIDQFRLQSALSHQQKFGGRLGRILVESGFITEERLVRCLSRQLGVSSVELATQQVHPRVLAEISRDVAERFGLCPVGVKRDPQGDVLYVAMSDPTNQEAIDAVQFSTGKRVEALVAGETAVREALERWYSPAALIDAGPDEAPLEVMAPDAPLGGEGMPVVTGSVVVRTPAEGVSPIMHAPGMPLPEAPPLELGAADQIDDVVEPAPARRRAPIEIDVGDPGEPIELASAAEFVTSSHTREVSIDLLSPSEPMELASAADFVTSSYSHDMGVDLHTGGALELTTGAELAAEATSTGASDRGLELSLDDGSVMETEAIGGFVHDGSSAAREPVLEITAETCPTCANPRIATAKFCPYCGTNLLATTPPTAVAPDVEAMPAIEGALDVEVTPDVEAMPVVEGALAVEAAPAVEVAPDVEPTPPVEAALPVVVDVVPPSPVVVAPIATPKANGHPQPTSRALTIAEIAALEAEPAPAGAVGALVDDVGLLATLQTRGTAPLFLERTPPPSLTGAARVDEPEVLRGEALVLAPHVIPGVRELASNEFARVDDIDVLVGGLRAIAATPSPAVARAPVPPPPPFGAAPPPPPLGAVPPPPPPLGAVPPPPPPPTLDAGPPIEDVQPVGAVDVLVSDGVASDVVDVMAGAPPPAADPWSDEAALVPAPDVVDPPIEADVDSGAHVAAPADLMDAPVAVAASSDVMDAPIEVDVDSRPHAAAPDDAPAENMDAPIDVDVDVDSRPHAAAPDDAPAETMDAPIDVDIDSGRHAAAPDGAPVEVMGSPIDVDVDSDAHVLAPAPVSAEVSASWADAFGPGAPEPAPVVDEAAAVDVDMDAGPIPLPAAEPPPVVLEDVEAIPLPTAEPPLASEWAALAEPAPVNVTKKSLAAEWGDVAETSIPRDVRDVRAAPVVEVPKAREVLVAASAPAAPTPSVEPVVVDRTYVPAPARPRTAAPWSPFLTAPAPTPAAAEARPEPTDLRALADRLTHKTPEET